MKLIVGLGNPGKEYEMTRHNMGYRVLDFLSKKEKIDIDNNDFHGVYGKGQIAGEQVILLKPETFMNLSGQSVFEIVQFFKIQTEDIIVIFDDMALVPGKIRLREKGSSGGHKGIQSVIDFLKTEEIKRIRVGIGEPSFDPINYVLGKVNKEDQKLTDESIEKAAAALIDYLQHDFHHAMSQYN